MAFDNYGQHYSNLPTLVLTQLLSVVTVTDNPVSLTFCSEPTLIEDDEDKEEPAPLLLPKPAAVPAAQSAIDLTADFLHPLLTPENVANLVSRRSLLFFSCCKLNCDIAANEVFV